MTRIFGLVLAGLVAFWTTIASAQSWVQIEAKRTLDEAETAARIYAQDFPNVAAFSLPSGWYAIALGPYSEAEAGQRLYALLSEGLIPSDSFVAENARFSGQVWPEGGAVAVAEPEPQPDPFAEAVTEPEPEPEVVDLNRIPEETVREARASEAALDPEAKKLIQIALEWEGFYTSAIDGDFGPGTRKSMAAWQVANGYEETGVLTTRQRTQLVSDYQYVVNSLKLETVRDDTAGIAVAMPVALVQPGKVDPPFAYYDERDGSGVRVILISQTGTKISLFGLFDILQTLEIIPIEGERSKAELSFSIDGTNATIRSHAEAKLTDGGMIKGFILVWPADDEKRFRHALNQMQASFESIDDRVLPDVTAEGGVQDPDLMSGLEIRRPAITRSGFYVSGTGMVLTTAEVLDACTRITLDDAVEMEVAASDAASGLALLKGKSTLAPLGYARFREGDPRLQSEAAVSGYAYDGRLGAPVLTYGSVKDVKGLNGEIDLARLEISATPSDAGGPVYDTSGAVFGLLLGAMAQPGQVLPGDVSFARDYGAISAFLTAQGVTPELSDATSDMAPEELTRRAADMTVRIDCWK